MSSVLSFHYQDSGSRERESKWDESRGISHRDWCCVPKVSTRVSRGNDELSRLVSLLLEHLKKFPVSETGGITLVKSVTISAIPSEQSH